MELLSCWSGYITGWHVQLLIQSETAILVMKVFFILFVVKKKKKIVSLVDFCLKFNENRHHFGSGFNWKGELYL
jgi:hypothetical protein